MPRSRADTGSLPLKKRSRLTNPLVIPPSTLPEQPADSPKEDLAWAQLWSPSDDADALMQVLMSAEDDFGMSLPPILPAPPPDPTREFPAPTPMAHSSSDSLCKQPDVVVQALPVTESSLQIASALPVLQVVQTATPLPIVWAPSGRQWARGDAAPIPTSMPQALAWPLARELPLPPLAPAQQLQRPHSSQDAPSPPLAPQVAWHTSMHGPPQSPAEALDPVPHAPEPLNLPPACLGTNDLNPPAPVDGPAGSLTAPCDSMHRLDSSKGRNLLERREWSASEDAAICASVAKHGHKWRRVAADVPGRSDDSVRNRWNRIQSGTLVQTRDSGNASGMAEAEASGGQPTPFRRSHPKTSVMKTSSEDGSVGGTAPEKRVSPTHAASTRRSARQSHVRVQQSQRLIWSTAEDEKILRAVNELGHRWAMIAERLPGRPEHGIRNRYARLQALAGRGPALHMHPSRRWELVPLGSHITGPEQ